jgi:Fe-Mn family superoxide dismutase
VTIITFPPLPYADTGLSPVISANTIRFHYAKHHKAYVDNLNKLIDGTDFEGLTLEEIICQAEKKIDNAAIFNNAAQAWNHEFYWKCLKQDGGGDPPKTLRHRIENSFGSLDACKKELSAVAVSQFGNGWAWLVLERGTIKAVKTGNANVPLTSGIKPLFVIDVWEHAYYLDYQNRRADYVDEVLEKLVNWDFIEANLTM